MGKVNVMGINQRNEGDQRNKNEDDSSSQKTASMRTLEAPSQKDTKNRRHPLGDIRTSSRIIVNDSRRSFYDEGKIDKIESEKTPNVHGELVSDEGKFKPLETGSNANKNESLVLNDDDRNSEQIDDIERANQRRSPPLSQGRSFSKDSKDIEMKEQLGRLQLCEEFANLDRHLGSSQMEAEKIAKDFEEGKVFESARKSAHDNAGACAEGNFILKKKTLYQCQSQKSESHKMNMLYQGQSQQSERQEVKY